MRLLDVRHEQTAAFAAEATGKLTRVPGLAVLTAGPGVTNGVSAIAQAQFAGSPMVVVGGRAPANRWGSGSLQELDQPPIVASVSKLAATLHTADDVLGGMHEAFTAAGSSHRGPVFVDVPMDEFFNVAKGELPDGRLAARRRPRHRRDRPDRRPARGCVAPGPDPRHRRLGRPGRRGGAALRRGRRRAGDHQRHGPRRHPGRPPAALHQGPQPGPGRRRPGRRGRHPARLPARLRRLRRQGGRAPRRRRSSTSPTPPARSPATPRWPTRSRAT